MAKQDREKAIKALQNMKEDDTFVVIISGEDDKNQVTETRIMIEKDIPTTRKVGMVEIAKYSLIKDTII